MSKNRFANIRSKAAPVPGYESGIWVLMVACFGVVALLMILESNRAKAHGFGFMKKVEVERVPAEEARKLGVTSRNN